MRENKTRILNHFCNDCQEQSDGIKDSRDYEYEALTRMKLVYILSGKYLNGLLLILLVAFLVIVKTTLYLQL